jgi:transcriptional regulator with XRE-family HTH domain
MTQEALAERLDVSVKYLQRIEAGKENLTIQSVVGLANALDVTLSYLIKPIRIARAKPGRPPATKRKSRSP